MPSSDDVAYYCDEVHVNKQIRQSDKWLEQLAGRFKFETHKFGTNVQARISRFCPHGFSLWKHERACRHVKLGPVIQWFSCHSVNFGRILLCRQLSDRRPHAFCTTLPSGDCGDTTTVHSRRYRALTAVTGPTWRPWARDSEGMSSWRCFDRRYVGYVSLRVARHARLPKPGLKIVR